MTALAVLERRALAALIFTDALGIPVTSHVAIAAPPGVRWLRKSSGQVVITAAPGLEDYAASFMPPDTPAIGSISVALDLKPVDSALDSRRITVRLPRSTAPGADNSVFQPLRVQLLPTPAAPAAGMAALLFVSLTRADDARAIEGALVRLRPEGGRPAARAFTDAAGNALLIVPGIPLASPGAGAVVRRDLPAALDAIVDPALARFHTVADIQAARRAAGRRLHGFIDPDELETRLSDAATPAANVTVAAGRAGAASLQWTEGGR